MTKIDERKNIIVSLKSKYRNDHKGIDYQIKNLRIMSILNISFSIICGGLVLTSVISNLFGFEILKWEKSSLLVVLSITFFLNFPDDIYELKLLGHLKKINDFKDSNELEKLNIELKKIIIKLNNRKNLSVFVILLIVLILLMGLWEVAISNNPYWIYMKIPILIFYGFIIYRFIQGYKRISENIEKVESTVANTAQKKLLNIND